VTRRPNALLLALELAALAGAVAVAVLAGGDADWDLPLLGVLLVLAVASDLSSAVLQRTRLKISGSFLAIVLGMVLLGATPAALIGAATVLLGWLRWREAGHYLLLNLVAYAWFPLAGGLVFETAREALAVTPADTELYILVFGAFVVALGLNFLIVVGYVAHVERTSLLEKVRTALIPVLPSELTAALLAVGISWAHFRLGVGAIALFGLVLVTFQRLVGALLVSQDRAEQLELRTRQLAAAQVGLLSALLHSLDLRDRMTARHSAAVARYAREIADAAGFSKPDQDLVHTAALLHDIGKFVLPDRILKASIPLSDDDWTLIRSHPAEGAMIVSQVEGYNAVADIILAHHERLDGCGYPRGLDGDEIPPLARIISIADTYDVMTARDSYRQPVSSEEAVAELRRVAGRQLDAAYVEVFVEVLRGRDLRYRHGEDADFDAELALGKRFEPLDSPHLLRPGALAPA
jgi:putative nucleotidyltransferase with HDIG domain